MDVLVIEGVEEYDAETSDADQLAIGLLGEEVRGRWGCRRCGQSPCLVLVERYKDRAGSGFALCLTCAYAVTDIPPYPKFVRA